jgi:hypothetical protein
LKQIEWLLYSLVVLTLVVAAWLVPGSRTGDVDLFARAISVITAGVSGALFLLGRSDKRIERAAIEKARKPVVIVTSRRLQNARRYRFDIEIQNQNYADVEILSVTRVSPALTSLISTYNARLHEQPIDNPFINSDASQATYRGAIIGKLLTTRFGLVLEFPDEVAMDGRQKIELKFDFKFRDYDGTPFDIRRIVDHPTFLAKD